MTAQDDNRCLWHMFENATHVLYIVMGLDLDTYVDTIQVRLATERGLDLFGRAAACLSPGFRDAHGDLPWARIAAVTATLAYPEGSGDDELVWDFLRKDLPPIMERLETLIGQQRQASRA